MDINGARTLARRVGPNGMPEREPLPSRADSETALPVFHWFGIDRPSQAGAVKPSPASGSSRRLGRFSLRRG